MRARGRRAVAAFAILAAVPQARAIDQLDLPALMAPRAAQSLLLGVAFAGGRVVAVGERGIVVASDDRGASWQQSPMALSATLTAVHFATASHGWAVGHDGVVLHSADAGRTWTRQLDGRRSNAMLLAAANDRMSAAGAANDAAALKRAEDALADARAAGKFGPSRPLLSVWFKNVSEGFAAGAYGMLLRTRNGGADWQLWSHRVDNPDAYHFNSIVATAAGTLLIAGEAGHVWRSNDGGESWQTLATGYSGPLYGALGVANESGGEELLAFGFKGKLFRLPAKTTQWRSVASGTTKHLTAGIVLPSGEPVLVAQDGAVLLGDRHGAAFTPLATVPLAATAVAASPDGRLAVSGAGGAKLVPVGAPARAVRP